MIYRGLCNAPGMTIYALFPSCFDKLSMKANQFPHPELVEG